MERALEHSSFASKRIGIKRPVAGGNSIVGERQPSLCHPAQSDTHVLLKMFRRCLSCRSSVAGPRLRTYVIRATLTCERTSTPQPPDHFAPRTVKSSRSSPICIAVHASRFRYWQIGPTMLWVSRAKYFRLINQPACTRCLCPPFASLAC